MLVFPTASKTWSSNMIYLGIDPGTTRIGYGVIQVEARGIRPLTWGILKTTTEKGVAEKQNTRKELRALVKKWKPKAAGVESLFFLNNKKSAMSVSEMRGVILLTLADAAVPIHEFTPMQVKQQICGHGQAQKHQMQRMTGLLLGIQERIESDDAADALALAICCSTQQHRD